MKPRIIVSKCLGFDECRYNGQSIPNDFVNILSNYVEFIPICPEVEIGLGVPRHPIRIVESNGRETLFQPATDLDHTSKMLEFCKNWLAGVSDVDGFILKYASPSCGLANVRVYPPGDKVAPLRKRPGFFGAAVLEQFSNLPIEDEGRLTNHNLRDRYMTAVFTLADFRENARDKKTLHDFQAKNKYLFLAINQEISRELGRNSAEGDIQKYKESLLKLLKSEYSRESYSNALIKAMDGSNAELNEGQKELFMRLIDEYKSMKIPLSTVLSVLRMFAVGSNDNYLSRQTIFEPYPSGLISVRDSGKVCE